MKLLPYGPRAVLAEFATLAEVMAATETWRAAALPGVVDVVPAARTVLVIHDGSFDPALLPSPAEVARPHAAGGEVVIAVDYDGVDLAEVATRCAMRVEEVIGLHCGAAYTVAFCGFMPGFSYLVGLDPRLHLPRRTTPRPAVPAGAVAIAAEFSAVYPRASPGGWHLLGRTDAVLWDDERDHPALLPPGTMVRFEQR